MITREAVKQAALSFKGTRFRHRGRSTQGLDCVGLLIAVGQQVGLTIRDTEQQYLRTPDSELFRQMIRDQSAPGDINCIRSGSILLLRQGMTPCHCGIAVAGNSGLSFLHASLEYRRVLDEPMEKFFSLIVEVREYEGVV